jgi:hypothetical protein
MTETWKDIKGYKGCYQASSKGKIRSIPRKYTGGGVLSPRNDSCGYPYVNLCKRGACRSFRVHRLVALAFLSHKPGKNCINHKNGIKTDNCVKNLEWCNRSENMLHAYKMGLKSPSRNLFNGNRKITKAQVLRMRLLKKVSPSMSYIKLGSLFKVTGGQAHNIIKHKCWIHI